jgi:hypothetical protein
VFPLDLPLMIYYECNDPESDSSKLYDQSCVVVGTIVMYCIIVLLLLLCVRGRGLTCQPKGAKCVSKVQRKPQGTTKGTLTFDLSTRLAVAQAITPPSSHLSKSFVLGSK